MPLEDFLKDDNGICFSSDESGVSQINRMKIDGTGKTKITNGVVARSWPLLN